MKVKHYNIKGRKECIEEMIDIFGVDAVITFCRINAYKYDYRAGHKEGNTKEQDLEKKNYYINKARELAEYEN